MVSSLVQRCLSICSRCSDIFFEKKQNTHPSSFMANCFTCLLNKLYCATHQLNTVEKKPDAGASFSWYSIITNYNKVL